MPLRTRNVKAGGVKEERAHVPSNDARMRGAQCPCRATKVRKYSDENGKATKVPCKETRTTAYQNDRSVGGRMAVDQGGRSVPRVLMGLTMRAGLSQAELK